MISSAFSFTRSSSRPHFHCVTARPSQKACSVERASPIRSRNPSRTSLVVSSENDHHPPLVNSRWPGGRVATHIYLVGKSTSRRRGCRLCVCGVQTRSVLHSIALSSGHRGESDHHPPLVNSRWPGGRVATHIYIESHGLWSDEQRRLAADVMRRVEAEKVRFVRLAWGDTHGYSRAKTLTIPAFVSALTNGYNIGVATTTLDSAGARVFASFTRGGGMGLTEMTGATNF